MNVHTVIAFALIANLAWSQSSTDESVTSAQASSPAQASSTDVRRTVDHDGQSFELVRSTSARNVDTDEYVLAGETIGTWTQLVTVQRLTLSRTAGTDEILAYFKREVTEAAASLEVIKQTRAATVFAVRFPQSDRNDEQVMLCLAFLDPANPSLINIVQYAIKPMQGAVAVVEMRLRSWRDKLLQQAVALEGRQ